MTQQGQHWQTNQHFQDLHFGLPLSVEIQSNANPNGDDYSPAITLTPARTSDQRHGFPFGLDDLNTSMPHVLDEESMDLSASAMSPDHNLISNESGRLKRLFEGGPWNPQSITSHPAVNAPYSGPIRFFTNKSNTIARPAGNFHSGFRLAPASNPESAPLNQPSPYFNINPLRGTKSVVSGTDVYDVPTDDASGLGDLAEAVPGINLNTTQYSPSQYGYATPFDTRTEPDLLSPHSKKSFKDASSTASQAGGPARKKRMHFCMVDGCDNTKGFGSSNDLERHKKSVHRIAPAHGRDRSWQCNIDGCKNATKVWPRLDNFKNHCRNCHKDEDISDLVKRSEIKSEDVLSKDTVCNTTPTTTAEHNARDSQTEPKARLLLKDETASVASFKGKSRGTISGAELARLSNGYPTFGPSNTTGTGTAEAGYLDDFLMPTPFLTQDHSGEEEEGANAHLVPDPPIHSFYSVSTASLQGFSINLLDEISHTLNLDRSSRDKVQELISISVYRLLNPDQESSTGSPDTTSTAVVAESSKRPDKKIHCKHHGCEKTFDRLCELKKHSKRHSRPYFCTWADCTSKRTFGSKADWTRHEKMLHYKHLTYRCQERLSTSTNDECDKIFIGCESYAMHLGKDHGMANQFEIDQRLGEKKVSPTAFWCGFCNTMLPVGTECDDVLKDRFDHIEEHVKKGQTVDEWSQEYDLHDNVQLISPISNGKRGSDVDSMMMGLQRDDSLFASGFYEDYDEHAHQHPRPKRPRAHEPEKDWASTTQSRGNGSNEWMNNGMIV